MILGKACILDKGLGDEDAWALDGLTDAFRLPDDARGLNFDGICLRNSLEQVGVSR